MKRCRFPVEWDGEWHDSSDIEQDITFTRSSSYVEGWKHTIFLDTITSWTCVDQETSNNLLLFKSIKPFISSHCYTTIRKIPYLHTVFISILDPNKQYMYLEHDIDCIAVSNGRNWRIFHIRISYTQVHKYFIFFPFINGKWIWNVCLWYCL